MVYDPLWHQFTNLNAAQIAAFQAFPQDLAKYAGIRGWQAHGEPFNAGGVNITLVSGQASFGSDPAKRQVTLTIPNVVPSQITPAQLAAAQAATVSRAQAAHDAYQTLLAGINATPPTVTTRAQIDAAYAAIP